MEKTTLVVLAAGIGSRYGAGVKQLERVGCCGEIIMDYAIYDAMKAGFNKVVFILRKDIEEDFREIIGNRISKLIEVEYVFQSVDNLPEGITAPAGRTKPLGTGHALWCCKPVVDTPFAVINADDYYGSEAYPKLHDFLEAHAHAKGEYCMAGFVLGNTLSDNGTVTRGVCSRTDGDMLASCEETYSIVREGDHAVGKNEAGESRRIELESLVSMNLWGLTPDFFDVLEDGLKDFMKGLETTDDTAKLKSEYLLPEIVGQLVKAGDASVKILDTNDKWYGITYESDKQAVTEAMQAITESGLYPKPLFGDKA